MRTKIGWVFFAHHKNLIMGEGGKQVSFIKNCLHFFSGLRSISLLVFFNLAIVLRTQIFRSNIDTKNKKLKKYVHLNTGISKITCSFMHSESE